MQFRTRNSRDDAHRLARVNSSGRPKLTALFDDGADHLRSRIVAIYVVLFVFNLGVWAWASVAFHRYPVLLGTALLAYSFGLRHAVDADHIAAIDNVTRKLMQDGKRPVAVGFMFSLGHSTMVIIGSAAIAGAALALQHRLDDVRNIGSGDWHAGLGVFSVCDRHCQPDCSAIHLPGVCKSASRRALCGRRFRSSPGNRGILSRMFRPMFRMISRSWHMYPLGVLFGLGFDTATEIGLLGISAAEASKGLSFWAILVFPILFAAGMSLIDTTDNILMLGAYGWAFVKPIRKLYYNMTITSVSVIVALVVGGIEALGLLGGHFHLKGWFWDAIARLNDNFGTLGYFIVGLFALSWIVSIAFYKWRRFDDLELKQKRNLPRLSAGLSSINWYRWPFDGGCGWPQT